MPFTMPSRTPVGPRRRSLLAGAALLTGCSPSRRPADETPNAADRARARAARDSAALVARYDAVIAAHPALADRLRPLRGEVARHAQAFGHRATPWTPLAPPDRTVSPDKEALSSLATAERNLSDRRTRELLTVPGELARLLASVAASGAAHAYLLTEDAK